MTKYPPLGAAGKRDLETDYYDLLRRAAREAKPGHRVAGRARSAVHRRSARESTLLELQVAACKAARLIILAG